MANAPHHRSELADAQGWRRWDAGVQELPWLLHHLHEEEQKHAVLLDSAEAGREEALRQREAALQLLHLRHNPSDGWRPRRARPAVPEASLWPVRRPTAWRAAALPFGLASSPYWAERLAQPIIQHLRSMGMTLVWYVDDLLLLGSTKEQVEGYAAYTLSLLTKLGIAVSQKKTMREAKQEVRYLGHTLDLRGYRVRAFPEKLQRAHAACRGSSASGRSARRRGTFSRGLSSSANA